MFENFKVPQELFPNDPRFGVGPSLIPQEALTNLAQTGQKLLGTSHRKDAVKNVVKEMQEGLKKYFNLPAGHEVVLGNGGATFLWDMIALGMVKKSSLHFITGEFSEKWYKAHKLVPWISVSEVTVPYGQGLNAEARAGFDMICTTLNETSTGVMTSELPEVDAQTILAIDATSGAGQIKVDFTKVDLYYFSPQKVFASEGGLYVAILSPKAIERAKKIQASDRYIPESMKWSHAIENSRNHQTYNTPAVSTIFLLNEQVKLMNAFGGEEKVIAEAKRKAKLMYDWAEARPYLSAFVEEKRFRSEAVVTIDLDEKYKAEDLSKILRAQGAAIDIDSYRKLGRNQFRIALFHNVTYENLEKLTKMIDLAINSLG